MGGQPNAAENAEPVQIDMRIIVDRPAVLTISVNSLVEVEVYSDDDLDKADRKP
jgi:hypothetical protein